MPFIDTAYHKTADLNKTAMEDASFSNYVNYDNYSTDISLDLATRGIETDVNCINQSIANILLTLKTERLFNLQFGTDIYKYLFEQFNSGGNIKQEVVNTILKYEKRIKIDLNDASVVVNEEEYFLEINIKYYIIETKQTGTWNDRLYA